MYACAERDRTKNQRINRKYKGTEGVSGEREGDLIRSYTERRGNGGDERGEEDVASNEGRRVIR